MARKKKHRRVQSSQITPQSPGTQSTILGVAIPKGDSKEDKKTRKQIIKDFYARWIASNPDKKIWNPALNAFIHVKGNSINETLGQASTSYESTLEVLRLTEILLEATLVKRIPPKRDSVNQKPYSEILIMRHKTAMLVVGKQETTGDYVQYCVSAKVKK